MSRDREISNEAHDRYMFSQSLTPFIQGAKWADSTMIIKICEWLKANANDYFVYDHINDECYLDVDAMSLKLKDIIK